MRIIKILLPILIILVPVFLYFLFIKTPESSNFAATPSPILTSYVQIGSVKINVELAKTPEQKSKGLSGRRSMPENYGLLFVFKPKTKPNFWMKDMLIPIDIIWISDGKVIGIEKSIPFPEPDTADARLPFYYPSELIDYALEVNAGYSDKNGVKAGDEVIFNL